MIGSAFISCGLSLLVAAQTPADALPSNLDLATVRRVIVQHDGRWMPLDTLARDCVESVTGTMAYQGRDAVLWLLAWSFNPQHWMAQPLIPIGNAELRAALELPADRETFSFAELASHAPLQARIEALAAKRGGKPDPLESKVGGLREQLNVLHAVFNHQVIRAIPHPSDRTAAWQPLGDPDAAAAPNVPADVHAAWAAMAAAFRADDAAAFAQAAKTLRRSLNELPAGYRPSAARIETELRYNRLRPFRAAWMIMVVGALLAAIAALTHRTPVRVLAIIVMIGGFGVLTYGLSLRWTIAGRIPATDMFESLLFLSWGMGAFGILSMLIMRDRIVPLTASGMGALALFLAETLPMDHFIRPIAPVLLDTIWMSIHVPVIMVSYSVLALAALIAHVQLVVLAAAPKRRTLIDAVYALHHWYLHVGCILLGAGIVTGSMWAASSWGRYWGWDPKEVWSLIAFLGYLAILHLRLDKDTPPAWLYAAAAVLSVAVFGIVAWRMAPLSPGEQLILLGAVAAVLLFVFARGPFATAAKSIIAFWFIIMTYVGVNFVLSIGLHSYGFGTGAVARYMLLTGTVDLVFVAACAAVYQFRRRAANAAPIAR
jgi:ABC-type transport system involved in cytochrome c biogenesis permease subunit